ncbi:MAG: biotin--[acetyl-CoA-carboxylase] ligase [Candidatus Marinimicrobia bacterium]|nr:biotin--[acetyl-CoA-carboxylase] ligase [Candidatus Neomarinimicrobiota bacterium]
MKIHSELDETILLNRIDSTNLEARRRRMEFTHRNVLFISDEQTAGQGQQDRHWESSANMGLWMSFFLARPSTLAHNLRLLSLYAGTMIHKTVEHFVDADVCLKWPNDIMIGSRKCGGVLTEIQWQGNTPISAIIGIGVNLSHRSSDFPQSIRDSAISLLQAGWQEPNREEFLKLFTGYFFQQLDQLDTSDHLMTNWNSLAYRLNENVEWQTKDKILHGQFLGINRNGEALIRVGKTVQIFQNGEIRQLNPV